jgi:hypothetical protein
MILSATLCLRALVAEFVFSIFCNKDTKNTKDHKDLHIRKQ